MRPSVSVCAVVHASPRKVPQRAEGPSTAATSLLCGKLFDETGDRLTPSHSKTTKGTRLRYYISHRLAARSGESHPGAWRLPAAELEARIMHLLRATLSRPGFAGSLLPGATTEVIARTSSVLAAVTAEAKADHLLDLVGSVEITPGRLVLKIDAGAVAGRLAIGPDAIDAEGLIISHPFQLRKRGVETRIVLADAPTGQDETLIRNIARAHAWFQRIKSGETFAGIAKAYDTSKRRVQQVIDLAFLAPDIVHDVMDGKQPIGFTSDWCLRHDLPVDWRDQRALIATL